MSIVGRLHLLPMDCRRILARTIAWMTTAAILDGVTGLILVFVIKTWFASHIAPWHLILSLAGLTLVQSLILYRASRMGFAAGSGLAAGLVTRLVDHLPKLDPIALGRVAPASGLLRGPGMQSIAIPAHLLAPLIAAVVTPVVVVTGLALFDPWAALGLLLASSCLGLCIRWSTGQTRAAGDARISAERAFAKQVQDFGTHQALLRSAGRTGPAYERLQAATEDLRAQSRALLRRTLPDSLLFGVLVQAMFAGTLVAGAWMVEHRQIDGPWLIAILVLLIRFVEPLAQLIHLDQALRMALQAFETLLRILDLPALASPVKGSVPADAGLEAKGVTLRLSDGPTLLSAIDCAMAPGTLTVVVGPSGAGKSTLLGLFARLHDPSEGIISLGGVDARTIDEATLAASRNLVPQDNGLFRGSIAWNLRMAKPHATQDDLRVAADDAAFPAMNRWPEEWNTDVGPGGNLLSGGERQRLCLARGFLGSASILLLDEPTASLDALAESRVLRSIAALRGHRTVVIVTHRPSLARLADRILVLDGGRLRAAGTHADLRTLDAWYASFVGADLIKA